MEKEYREKKMVNSVTVAFSPDHKTNIVLNYSLIYFRFFRQSVLFLDDCVVLLKRKQESPVIKLNDGKTGNSEDME